MSDCKFCGKQCKNDNSLRNHERLCKENPNRQVANIEAALSKANAKTETCEFCADLFSLSNIKKHTNACRENPANKKTCPVCLVEFSGNSVTCSHSCSNRYFRHAAKGGIKFKEDDVLLAKGDYRQLCFRYHKKACVVCGEDKIVAVHHLNEDHSDNRPENLIPLCPTHHQYVHSRYKKLVQPIIVEYLRTYVGGSSPPCPTKHKQKKESVMLEGTEYEFFCSLFPHGKHDNRDLRISHVTMKDVPEGKILDSFERSDRIFYLVEKDDVTAIVRVCEAMEGSGYEAFVVLHGSTLSQYKEKRDDVIGTFERWEKYRD